MLKRKIKNETSAIAKKIKIEILDSEEEEENVKNEAEGDFLTILPATSRPSMTLKRIKIEMEAAFKCQKCGRAYQKKFDLKNHQCLVCEICSERCASNFFECDACGVKLKSKRYLRVHLF